MTNEEIQNIFFLECEEALVAAEEGLMACRNSTANGDTVNGIFRAVHSIKGGAGAFSFTALQAFTHKFETVLSYVRDGELGLSESLNTLMLRAFDVLADHVSAARGLATTPDDAAVSAELERVAEAAANGQPLKEEALEEEASATVATPEAAPDDLGLDFNLDVLLGDLEFKDEPQADETAAPETVAVEAAAPAMVEPAAREASAAAEATGTGWNIFVRPRDAALANGSEPLLMLRELQELGGAPVAVDAASLPTLDLYDADKAYIGWNFWLPSDVEESAIKDIFDFIGEACEVRIERTDVEPTPTPQVSLPAITPAAVPTPAAPVATVTEVAAPAVISEKPAVVAAPKAVAPASPVAESPAPAAAAPISNRAPASVAPGQTVRVDLAKLDRLIDTVGELVIAQAMMAQNLINRGITATDEMGMLDQLTREIQESTMAIRAQPIGSVFSRVPRIVRELEADTGKKVILVTSGESTELDKTVVERLGEPLTHLIRNAVDHGIEKPEVRLAAGKPAEGRLHLSAEQRSGRIVISLSDDGAGINRERVLAKAIEKGIVAPGATLSNDEIDNLIFAPGFSTAEKVSNISGRGVGMDVVRQNVKDLGGRISIESHPGKGCTFTLALPLTLAIADGMIVKVGDQTVVLPLTHVLESLRPEEADVKHIGTDLMVLNNRGQFLPIVPLETPVRAQGAEKDARKAVLIVVETESHGQAALMADAIVDQRQFVIKSLEANFQPVAGVAGATILGDGKVALILDVDSLVTQTLAQNPQNGMTRAAA